jgi:hypothetical protein
MPPPQIPVTASPTIPSHLPFQPAERSTPQVERSSPWHVQMDGCRTALRPYHSSERISSCVTFTRKLALKAQRGTKAVSRKTARTNCIIRVVKSVSPAAIGQNVTAADMELPAPLPFVWVYFLVLRLPLQDPACVVQCVNKAQNSLQHIDERVTTSFCPGNALR